MIPYPFLSVFFTKKAIFGHFYRSASSLFPFEPNSGKLWLWEAVFLSFDVGLVPNFRTDWWRKKMSSETATPPPPPPISKYSRSAYGIILNYSPGRSRSDKGPIRQSSVVRSRTTCSYKNSLCTFHSTSFYCPKLSNNITWQPSTSGHFSFLHFTWPS